LRSSGVIGRIVSDPSRTGCSTASSFSRRCSFLEAAPEGVDPDEIGHALAAAPAVVSVRDLHVWEVTSGFQALIVVGTNEDCHEARARLEQLLRERFATAGRRAIRVVSRKTDRFRAPAGAFTTAL
jgi:Co/Zn/Cd efflux system component